jgi:hypothetical membrane protein
MSTGQARAKGISEQLVNQLLLACGVIGPPLFIIVFLIEDATRPDYSAWRNFVSSLGLGPGSWMQIANFIICGALCVGFAVGLRRVLRSGTGRVWGPILLGVFGLSLIIAGLFVTDPSLGYPPGASSNTQTLHGTIHGINAPIAFGSLSAAIFVLARRFASDPAWRRWSLYSLVIGILCVGCFITSLVVAELDMNGVLPNAPAGLLERIVIILGWSWIALLAARLLGMARSRAA